jgi:hypothetical protein
LEGFGLRVTRVETGKTFEVRLKPDTTAALTSEITLPGRAGDGGVPRWVQEGIANYMVGDWPDGDERLMRELVAAGDVPALSQLTGSGGSRPAGDPRAFAAF